MIIKFDAQGNQIWNRTGSEYGSYRGIWVQNSHIYALGSVGFLHRRILVDKWDSDGNFVSTRTYGRAIASLDVEDVWGNGQHLFVCGTASERGVFLTQWEF